MFGAIKQFFIALTSFFVAFEKSGNIAVNLTTWGDEASATFADKARQERQLQTMEFEETHAARLKAIEDRKAKAAKALAAPAKP